MGQAARKSNREPEPAWEIAYLFPPQGMWDEEEYLDLDSNWLIEFTDGRIDVLPMPTTSHQRIGLFLYRMLLAFVTAHDLGEVLAAPLRIRIRKGKFREPDVVFMHKVHADRIGDRYWKGADLVMEVVSDDATGRRRDLVEKRRDYAEGKIREYWIVDPTKECITVLRLRGKRYVVHGVFARDQVAASHLLPGFSVKVSEVMGQRLTGKRGNRRR